MYLSHCGISKVMPCQIEIKMCRMSFLSTARIYVVGSLPFITEREKQLEVLMMGVCMYGTKADVQFSQIAAIVNVVKQY